jgi:hypothetical protein
MQVAIIGSFAFSRVHYVAVLDTISLVHVAMSGCAAFLVASNFAARFFASRAVRMAMRGAVATRRIESLAICNAICVVNVALRGRAALFTRQLTAFLNAPRPKR